MTFFFSLSRAATFHPFDRLGFSRSCERSGVRRGQEAICSVPSRLDEIYFPEKNTEIRGPVSEQFPGMKQLYALARSGSHRSQDPRIERSLMFYLLDESHKKRRFTIK